MACAVLGLWTGMVRAFSYFACWQSEHASKLREPAHRQLRSHANAPTTERQSREAGEVRSTAYTQQNF